MVERDPRATGQPRSLYAPISYCPMVISAGKCVPLTVRLSRLRLFFLRTSSAAPISRRLLPATSLSANVESFASFRQRLIFASYPNVFPLAFGVSCFSVPHSAPALLPPSQNPRVSPSNGNGVSVPVGLLRLFDILVPCVVLQHDDCCTALPPADCSHGRKLIAKLGRQL